MSPMLNEIEIRLDALSRDEKLLLAERIIHDLRSEVTGLGLKAALVAMANDPWL